MILAISVTEPFGFEIYEVSVNRLEIIQFGLVLLEVGKKEEAMAEWRKALALDPQNWIIHKQIWAVEHPDKFYDGDVDYGWQKGQLNVDGGQ